MKKRYLLIINGEENDTAPNQQPYVIGLFSSLEEFMEKMYPHLDDALNFKLYDQQTNKLVKYEDLVDEKELLEIRLDVTLEGLTSQLHYNQTTLGGTKGQAMKRLVVNRLLSTAILQELGFEKENSEFPDSPNKEAFRIEETWVRNDIQESTVAVYTGHAEGEPDQYYWVQDNGTEIRLLTDQDLFVHLRFTQFWQSDND